MERLYTINELCERYNVQSATIWRWIKTGELPAMKIGKSYRIKESCLQEFEKQAEK